MDKKQEPNPLKFTPVTDGLGFHPFANGLPYAPLSKTSSPSTGRGAVAAGPPQFVSAPRVSVPVVKRQPNPVIAQAQPNPILIKKIEPTFGFIYLFKRISAFTFDTAFNLTLCFGTLSAAMWKQELSFDLLFNPSVLFLSLLFLAAFNWSLITAQEILFRTTLGKRLFGLSLHPSSTAAVFLRAFFFVPSLAFCGFGILWAIFDRKKRCWHDLVVDLQPHEIARL